MEGLERVGIDNGKIFKIKTNKKENKEQENECPCIHCILQK